MGATRPHNPAARGELLGRYRALAKSEPNEENKPTLNTKLRILPTALPWFADQWPATRCPQDEPRSVLRLLDDLLPCCR